MNAHLASLALLVLACPLCAEPGRFLVEGRVILPAGWPAGEALAVVARRGAPGLGLVGAELGSVRPDAEGRFRLALDLADPGFALRIESRWLELWPQWIEPRAGSAK